MKVLVTGATGTLGQRVVSRLEKPVVLARDPQRARAVLGDVEVHAWDALAGPPPLEAFAGVRAVLHLAGEPIAMGGRWTEEKKRIIRESRVSGTRQLVEAMARLSSQPEALVTASAIGFYGERGEEPLEERASCGSGFWPEVCRDWESEAARAEALGVRVVSTRIGLVFGERGGFFQKTLNQYRLGLGGPIGDGRAWMSWIHAEDLIEVFLRALEDSRLSGPVNATAPEPLRNADFSRALARALRRPAFLRMPRGLIASALGEVAEALLVSQRVLPSKLAGAGFQFRYPGIDSALEALICPGRRAA